MLTDIPAYIREDVKIAQWVKDTEKLDNLAFNQARRVGAPVKLGSNTRTLAPDITGTGFPILVGQPQMGHTLPSIIFEVALKGGRFDAVGMAFPLWPSIPIGHNHYLTWSHMVGLCDNVDVYQEILNPLNKEEYLFNGKWRKMEKRTEKIRVAGGEVKEIPIYRTVHGPVFSPFPFDPQSATVDKVYSKKSSHWKIEALTGDAWWKMMTAKNATEFGEGAAMIMTSLHTSYADIHGNIGTYIQIVELRPEGAVGYSRWPLGQSGNISASAEKKPVFDPHFLDMLPHYKNYTY
ncbi:MAG: penicillin acylase family protein, partial [Nitrospinales bacterium]